MADMIVPFAGMFGMLAGGLLVLFSLLSIAIYVYSALALMTIAKKLGHKMPWLAWIPFANVALVLQLGEFHWAWVFLVVVPFLGWAALGVLSLIAMWRIYEARQYPGWLALVPLLGFIPVLNYLGALANLIIIGLVAWKDQPKKRKR